MGVARDRTRAGVSRGKMPCPHIPRRRYPSRRRRACIQALILPRAEVHCETHTRFVVTPEQWKLLLKNAAAVYIYICMRFLFCFWRALFVAAARDVVCPVLFFKGLPRERTACGSFSRKPSDRLRWS